MEVNMSAMTRRMLLALSIAGAAGSTFSCSTSNAPQPGTPAYFWAAANETFAANDYVKTSEHLDKILASDNEYTARARTWSLILISGMARGNMDLADNFEYGVKAKKADPGGFRKYISNSRSTAGRLGLQFAEAFMRFQKGKDDPVVLAFHFPSGSAAPVPEFTRASVGQPLLPTEIESAQKHAIERAILLQTCAAAGAADDTAKALDLFKSGSAQVPRATFMTAMANVLYDQAQLFGPRKLDDPEKMKVFSNLASGALKDIPETKQTKELSAKLEAGMKKK
jgi:hypothetical protein